MVVAGFWKGLYCVLLLVGVWRARWGGLVSTTQTVACMVFGVVLYLCGVGCFAPGLNYLLEGKFVMATFVYGTPVTAGELSAVCADFNEHLVGECKLLSLVCARLVEAGVSLVPGGERLWGDGYVQGLYLAEYQRVAFGLLDRDWLGEIASGVFGSFDEVVEAFAGLVGRVNDYLVRVGETVGAINRVV